MRNKGYTLIEMIVVVAILGILLGIVAVPGRDWMDRSRVEGQTKQMYADLMNARVNALKNKRFYFVTLGVKQYSVYEDTPNGNGTLDLVADQVVMQKSTRYALVSTPTITMLNFSADGLATFTTATTVDIWCQSTGSPASDCIEISLTRILMGKWNGTTSTCIVQ